VTISAGIAISVGIAILVDLACDMLTVVLVIAWWCLALGDTMCLYGAGWRVELISETAREATDTGHLAYTSNTPGW
jgi:hypothetical protein